VKKVKFEHRSIQEWLRAARVSPVDGARKLHISTSYLYYILEGKRKPGRGLLQRMARVGIDPMNFL
jgi:hypothetical protein